MKNIIDLDAYTGHLIIDGFTVNYSSESDFSAFVRTHITDVSIKEQGGITKYSFDTIFAQERFALTADYSQGIIRSLYMVWRGGLCSKNGWASSDRDLCEDKKRITALLINRFNTKPTLLGDYKDEFTFDWGSIVSAASPHNMTLTIVVTTHRRGQASPFGPRA